MSTRPHFLGREAFQHAGTYRFLPFRFLRLASDRVLLTNDVGEYFLLSSAEFDQFVTRNLDSKSDVFTALKGRHFLFDSDSLAPFELLVRKYRTKKAHLAGFTKLHMFVVSLRCEHSCHYCQVSRVSPDKSQFDMSSETASRAVDLVFRAPAERLKIEFQGGEPLLNFERIRQIVEDADFRATERGKKVDFVVATNLALIGDEVLTFCREHRIAISTSLDGPAFIHNANRPRPQGDSYEVTVEGINRVRAALGDDQVAAVMTTTRLTLDHPREVVDEYVGQGFNSIFLRPLSPYGFATKTAHRIGYSIDEFLRFYFAALEYIIELNKSGTYLIETYAQILLTRLLTPFPTGYVDLQSPAGAAIGAVVYNYDGEVYASDESRMLAEMGDRRFRLGSVHNNTYEEMFAGPLIRELVDSSVIEAVPGCSDCGFAPYCGVDPIFNYAMTGDLVGRQATSDFHRKNFEIIRWLISRYDSDPSVRPIFWSWIQERPQPLPTEARA